MTAAVYVQLRPTRVRHAKGLRSRPPGGMQDESDLLYLQGLRVAGIAAQLISSNRRT